MTVAGLDAMLAPVPVTVLIVDDHDRFRASARQLLEADGFVVIGESASGWEAVADAARLDPDLVLLDIQLPDIDGFEVAGHLAAAARPPAVVLISSREAVDYGDRLSAAAALGFLSKRELDGTALAALLG